MKAVCKKLFSLMLVAILLVSAVPFQASAEEVNETVAPVEATVPAAEAEIVATSPEAYQGEVMDKDEVRVDFQLEENEELYTISKNWRVSVGKSKIGSTEAPPKGSKALAVLEDAIDNVDGIEFVRWYYVSQSGEKVTYTSSTVLSMDTMVWETRDENEDGIEYPYVDVYAEFKRAAATITLKPNGGTVATTKHKVMIGMPYSEYGVLPTPTRSGYEFLGWYKADGTLVTNDEDSIVTTLGALTAEWAAGKYTVTYKGYTDGIWDQVGFGSFDVDPNSVLKTAYNNFPSDSQIDEMFDVVEGWEIDGWEYSNDNEKTWKTFTAGKTKITGTTTIRPLYKKSITLYACDSGNTTRSLTVTLGKPFPALPHPGTRDGYAFVGWYMEPEASNLVSTKDNLSNVSAHPVVEGDVEALYAGGDIAKTVYLYIYTNGETDEHTKLVRYYDVPQTGFDLTDVDLYEIFPNYGKYDDKGDEKYGWYDNAQWKNYCMNKHVNDTTEYIVPGDIEDDVLEFHIMLIDNGNNASTGSANGTGYNDNKTTVDSSNPSTGDNIFVAVTIMAVSACAVLLIFMNKKRIVK